MAQPSNDLISQVCGITALDEGSAIVLLKVSWNTYGTSSDEADADWLQHRKTMAT